ncbi:hypothetical protein PR048_000587 [Dryococelus australis]|uniref:Endonuclease/exonuclease/phosphatase domain-containing protein n=1 Tax=Dryococelus australis TaxID=614101 RepID=A0ABQ9IF24_9NEOP|nr:hypothetical protein PR048_000587 [Dryococelus australis]
MYLNARSLRNKMGEIETLISTVEVLTCRSVAITESWINSNETKYYNIEGYDSFFARRDEHSLLDVQLDSSVVTNCRIHILICYNPSKGNCPVLLQKFENLLRNVQSRYTIVIGDFNIDSLSNSKEMQDYTDLITRYGFYQVNTIFPTGCSKTTNSLIDHVLVNKTQYGYIDSCVSDHNVIVSEVTTGINKQSLSRCQNNESKTDH